MVPPDVSKRKDDEDEVCFLFWLSQAQTMFINSLHSTVVHIKDLKWGWRGEKGLAECFPVNGQCLFLEAAVASMSSSSK